jgi:hypothetical protein
MYKFQNRQPPGDLKREVIARQFVRNLEKIVKVQVQQLESDSWTHLRILTPGKLKTVFTKVSDPSLRLIQDESSVYVYFDENITPMDARNLIGEIIINYKRLKDPFWSRFRRNLAMKILQVAKLLYPKSKK